MPDPDEFVLSFLGAVMGGIVPVPISPQLTFKNIEGYHDTVAHIASAAGAWLPADHAQATRQYVDPVVPRVESLRGVVTVDELGREDHGPIDVVVEPDDLAFLSSPPAARRARRA